MKVKQIFDEMKSNKSVMDKNVPLLKFSIYTKKLNQNDSKTLKVSDNFHKMLN